MIYKFNQGGNSIPPLVSYKALETNKLKTSKALKEPKDEESSDLTDKDLLKMLGDLKALPSDIDAITDSLLNFYIDLQYGISTSNITSKYIQTLTLMKKANSHREEYDKAFNIVSKNGGINEVAIDEKGKLYCVDTQGNFDFLTLEQLDNNSEFLAVTNSDLLYYRYKYPRFANNLELITIVQNGIGIEGVTKTILDNINNLGTSTNSNEGFERTKNDLIIGGLKEFILALKESGSYDATVDNLYKGKIMTKSQAALALDALNFIYRTLPKNAKTLLRLKTENHTEREAIELVSRLINSRLSDTNEFSVSLQRPEKGSGKDGKDSDGSDLKMNFVASVLAGLNGHNTVYKLDNAGGVAITVEGTAFELAISTRGDHIGKTSMDVLLNASGLRSIINADNGIFFGNLKIDAGELLNITYDGKGLVRTNLPITSAGSPNFDILEEYSQAEAEFLFSNLTPADRVAIFNDVEKYPNLAGLIKPNGELDTSKFAPFMITSGMTTNALVNLEDKNKFITEVKQTTDLVKQLKINLSTGSGKEKMIPEIDDHGWAEILSLGINSSDKLFKGNVYIPVNMNKGAAALGSNLNPKSSTGNMLEEEYLLYNKGPFKNLDPSSLK